MICEIGGGDDPIFCLCIWEVSCKHHIIAFLELQFRFSFVNDVDSVLEVRNFEQEGTRSLVVSEGILYYDAILVTKRFEMTLLFHNSSFL